MSGRAGVEPTDFTFPDFLSRFDWLCVSSLLDFPDFFSSSLLFFIRSIIRRFRLDCLPDVGLSQATEIPESTSVSGNEKISSGALLA